MNQGLTIVPPPVVGEALRRLEAQGFQAWCVGGCVRDSLLGKAPFDKGLLRRGAPGGGRRGPRHHRLGALRGQSH